MDFKAEKIEKLAGFVYYVDKISRLYSSARTKKNANALDYTIELKIVLLIDGEKKVQELAPIVLASVPSQLGPFNPVIKHRTDIIPSPEGAVLTEVSIKIIESNPVKVRAERILSLWNDNKDSVKTIVNNYLPKEKDDADAEGNSTSNGDENTSVGNEK